MASNERLMKVAACRDLMIVFAAAAVLGGCGSGRVGSSRASAPPITATPSPNLVELYDKTTALKTISFRISETFTGSRSGTLAASGLDSYTRRDASMNQTIVSNGQTSSKQELFVGTATYVAVPAGSRSQTGGRPWIEVTGLTPVERSTYPTDSLQLLLADPSNVHKVGQAVVTGTNTTEYEAIIALAPSSRYSPLLTQLLSQFRTEMGTSSATIHVWVDQAGVVRQMSYDLQGTKATEKATLQLGDFGVAVNIPAPPASQVFQVAVPTQG